MKGLLAIGALTLLLQGCASITDGTTQTLAFRLQPRDTKCVLTRGGDELGTVNGRSPTISVSKGARDIIAQCEALGYEPKTLRLVSSTQASGVVGGFFLDLGITDMITGAMWKYDGTINVVLNQDPEAIAAMQQGFNGQASVVAGKWSDGAVLVPEVAACNPSPRAKLVDSNGVSETYSIACIGGRFLTVNCDKAACKAG